MPHSNHRIGFKFWFNLDKPDESALADTIELLKNKRSFTSVIRDGIRLICDLRDGKLDVLFELFPWVRAEFMEYMREIATDGAGRNTSENRFPIDSDLDAERAWLEAEQERMEQERIWEQRRLEEAQRALEAERRTIEQERQRMEAERAAKQSAMQEQLDRVEQLLLQKGHVPIESPTQLSRSESPPNHSGGPKPLSVQKFSAPAYDDDDEDDEDLLEVKVDVSAGKRATQNFLKSLMNLTEETKQPPKPIGNTLTRQRRTRELGQ